jgi:hypothetical protein
MTAGSRIPLQLLETRLSDLEAFSCKDCGFRKSLSPILPQENVLCGPSSIMGDLFLQVND